MKKIYFQNSKKWKSINADIYAADGNVCKSVSLGEAGDSLELSTRKKAVFLKRWLCLRSLSAPKSTLPRN